MKLFSDIFLTVICSYAFLIYFGRLIKMMFNPGFLQHRLFDFPAGRFKRMLLLLSALIVLAMTVLLKLRLL